MRPLSAEDFERIVHALPELSDGRIRLRRWRPADAPAIVAAAADGSIATWVVGMPWPYALADARAFLKRARRDWAQARYVHLAVTDELTGHVVGAVGLNLHAERQAGEAGYWVALIEHWAFAELQLQRLELVIHVDNLRSQRVADKAGFSREGVLRSYLLHRGTRGDYWLYSRLPSDSASPSVASPSQAAPVETPNGEPA